MNRRQKIIISVTGIFIVLLALIGLTYAYFLTRITGNTNTNSISVTTANLQLVYADGNGILQTGKLEPSNDYITFLDGQGNEHSSKIFTVTNNGNATVEDYKVYLENVQNQFERKDDLVYTLTCKSYINYDKASKAISGECTGVNSEITFPSVITSIVSNDIAVGITHEYELKVKYKEMGVDQSVDMNKLLSAKINIYDSTTKFLAREILDNALSTATVTYNKSTYIEPTLQDGTTYTIPAHATSLANERILTYTMDDYGTSYYYRGNVEDNYVTFSNKCWRIVRIQGDGSIKLTLESQSRCSEDMTSDFSIGSTNWGYKTENSKDIGDYKSSTSGMKNLLTTWFDTNFKSDGNLTNAGLKIKNEEWCLGNITNAYAYKSPYGELGTTAAQNYISGTNFYYETGRNLYGKGVTPNATLKCNGETDSSKIGALTADEVAFAGGKAGSANTNYYLHNSSYYWWTLSRSDFYGAIDYAFRVGGIGGLYGSRVDNIHYVRPAVSLNTGAKIISGEGTKGNPYIINEG